jgi:hypothetical protein
MMVIMNTFRRLLFQSRLGSLGLPFVACLAMGAAGGALSSNAAAKKPKHAPAPADAEGAPAIRSKEIFEATQKLTTEELADRFPGSLGDARAREYLVGQWGDMKLLPPGGAAAAAAPAAAAAAAPAAPAAKAASDDDSAADDPSAPPPTISSPFLQTFPITVMKTRLLPGGTPTFKSTAATVPVQLKAGLSDVILFAGEPQSSVSLREAEVTFVGYGLTVPEFQWDDY